MAKKALDVHCKTKKHSTLVNASDTTASTLSTWLLPPTLENQTTKQQDQRENTSTESSAEQVHNEAVASTAETRTLSQQVQLNLDVSKAEILYVLEHITKRQSYNSAKHSSVLFQTMFPDSQIAKAFTCGPSKMSYLTVFGLASYFETQLIEELDKASFYSVSFDESYNKITKNEQMDFAIRFWDSQNQLIVNRYLGSQFLGHATAIDLLKHFQSGTSKLNTKKITQISMDGPNVNLKFHRDFVSERNALEPEIPSIIEIGSCGLHVVLGAFGTIFESTGWKLDSILKSLYYLFNESPARKADYTEITKSKTFPLQFCGTRWVEDVMVAKRAVLCWPNVTKYIVHVSSLPKNKIPKCSSYKIVLDAVADPTILAKLQVFIVVADQLHPFLELFQCDKPMVPFLAQEVSKLMKSIMEIFIKKSLLPDNMSMTSILNVDVVDKKNHVLLKKVTIGFAAQTVLKNKNISTEKIEEFKQQILVCYKTFILKIKERSPLKYEIARQLCCMDPRYMSSHPNSSTTKFEGLIATMIDKKFLKPEVCDKIVKQYKALLRKTKIENSEDFKNYDIKSSERLDVFFRELIGEKT
jgi:hypothetical protein